MIVISWNVQWGRGVDGRLDLARVVDTARAMADFDVLCLQEVADNYPGLQPPVAGNQWAQLAELLPGYCAIEGVAIERHTAGVGRQRFGNMILCREAPLQVLRHALPWPGDPHQPSMPRMALEAVLPAAGGAVRVLTTHLEYYSAPQRAAQVEALRHLQREALTQDGLPARADQAGKPFETRPRAARRGILCGDFNCDAADPMIARLQQPAGDGAAWCDAWPLAHPGRPHAMTLGLHDRDQWPEGPRCFDMFFVTADLADAVRRVEVDAVTQASDHQPVLLEVALG